MGEYLLSPSDDPVILAVNDVFLAASGRTRESLVGHRLFAVFPGNPGDAGDTGVAALGASLARVVATGLVDELPLQRYPILVRRPDGTEVYEERYWRAINTPIFGVDGQLDCIAHRTEDVTESIRVSDALRRSTARQAFQLMVADRLRQLSSPAEIASTASALLGERFGITRVTYVEVDDADASFVQRHWVKAGGVEPPDERRRLEDFGAEIIATLRAGRALVIEDVRTDPRTAAHADAYAGIDVRSNLAIPLVKSGQLTLVLSLQHDAPRAWSEDEVALAADIAERTWAAAESARAEEKLQEESRRKDEFLAMLAHELRNPLAPITVSAELIANGALEGPRLRAAGAIVARQASHLAALVDDLLDVSRVTSGLVVLDEAPQDMRALVVTAVEQARSLIESRGHVLDVDLPDVPAGVFGDGKRLIQVVSNLLTNAAKFTPPNGRIRVALVVADDAVVVDVTDNGIGVPNELHASIFELFVQAERSPDRAQGGLGLGLALVRNLVRLHRGTVTVHSDGPGTGSRFVVTLPRVALLPHPPAPAPCARADCPGLDILLVDDNPDAAEALHQLLDSAGHRVRVTHEADGAIDAVRQAPPQVAFIDIGLPIVDGYELIGRLRALPGGAAMFCVAFTGYGQPEDRRRALAAGFDEHLVKPAAPDRLFDLIDAVAMKRSTPGGG